MKVQQIAGNQISTFAATRYFPIGNSQNVIISTESYIALTYRTAGQLSNLRLYVSSNATTAPSTAVSRKNLANGNQSITIGAGATGEFEDNTNVDTIAAGDEVCGLFTIGSANNILINFNSSVFNADSKTVSMMVVSTAAGLAITTASVSRYGKQIGTLQGLGTEANAQMQYNTAGTLSNSWLYVSTNARTTTTTFRTRINGVNGNLSISVGAGATGIFEDTSNSDVVAVNDLICNSYTTGAGTETLTLLSWKNEFTSTNSKYQFGGFGKAHNVSETNYFSMCGGGNSSTTETDFRADAKLAMKLSNLWAYLSANSADVTTTFNLRVNGQDSALTMSIGAGATGAFEDTTNTVKVYPTDEINHKVSLPAGTGTATFQTYSTLAEILRIKDPIGMAMPVMR